ncbi:MAG TPA: hypothetical protein VK886_07690 [Vicinamibacterales bacterium]|nr:hypothetical protein [Vicinamibacterales bacterium]
MGGEAIIAKQNRYMRKFRERRAVSGDSAVTLAELGQRDSWVFRGLVKRGVIHNAGADRFYLDQQAADAFVERRRQVFVWSLAALVIVALVIALAAR